MKAMRVALAVSIISTGFAGLYLVVYLYRWEMHRALVAGVIFIAGEVALATLLILRRLERLGRPPVATATQPVAVPFEVNPDGPTQAGLHGGPAHPREGAPPPSRFPWLDPTGFSVFVPILIGAGVIVSGVAWLIEHLARMTTRPGERGHVERRLSELSVPSGDLWSPGGTPAETVAGNGRRRLFRGVAVAFLFGSLVVILLTLALLGRTRPEAPIAGARSHIELEVRTSLRLDRDVGASSLWGACHSWVAGQELVELRRLDTETYLLVLEPALGEQARQRLHGCLNDGTLERVNAHVRSHTIVPIG